MELLLAVIGLLACFWLAAWAFVWFNNRTEIRDALSDTAVTYRLTGVIEVAAALFLAVVSGGVVVLLVTIYQADGLLLDPDIIPGYWQTDGLVMVAQLGAFMVLGLFAFLFCAFLLWALTAGGVVYYLPIEAVEERLQMPTSILSEVPTIQLVVDNAPSRH